MDETLDTVKLGTTNARVGETRNYTYYHNSNGAPPPPDTTLLGWPMRGGWPIEQEQDESHRLT